MSTSLLPLKDQLGREGSGGPSTDSPGRPPPSLAPVLDPGRGPAVRLTRGARRHGPPGAYVPHRHRRRIRSRRRSLDLAGSAGDSCDPRGRGHREQRRERSRIPLGSPLGRPDRRVVGGVDDGGWRGPPDPRRCLRAGDGHPQAVAGRRVPRLRASGGIRVVSHDNARDPSASPERLEAGGPACRRELSLRPYRRLDCRLLWPGAARDVANREPIRARCDLDRCGGRASSSSRSAGCTGACTIRSTFSAALRSGSRRSSRSCSSAG